MAYISAYKTTTYTTAATSTVGALPAHVSGDLLVAVFEMQNGADDFGTPSGWTPIVNAGSSNCSAASFYLVATSSSETDPTSTGHTSEQYRACTCYVIKDAPAVSPIDTSAASAGYNTSANTRSSRSATTTANNVLLLHTLTEPQWRQHLPDPGPMVLFRRFYADGAFSGSAAWTFQESFGPVSTFNWRKIRGATEDVTMVIPIKSDAGIIPARGGAACSTPVFAGADGGYYGYTVNNIAATVTAINGTTTINNPAGVSSDPGAGYNAYSYAQRFQGSGATSGYQSLAEYEIDASAVSMSNKKVAITWAIGSGLYAQRVDTLENDGIVLGLRSGTNEYIFYRAGGSDSAPKSTTAVVVDENTSGIGHTGGGTFDPTDIKGVVASVGNASNTAYANVDQVHVLDAIEVIGGNTADPEGWSAAYQIAVSANLPTVEKLGDAYRTKQDITVGDGSSFLNFETNGTTLFLARPASVARKDVEMQAAGVNIILRAQASNQTIKINNPIVSAGNAGDTFTIHASSTSSGNWEFGGSLSGFVTDDAISLRDVGSGAYAGFTFSGCGEIAHNGADLTGGVTFDGCVGTQVVTITGATQSALQTGLAKFAAATFQNSTTYAIRLHYTGTGDITITGPAGITFSNSGTADMVYESDNASALTFTPGSGSTSPSTDTDGAATGFTIDSATAITLTAANIIDDSRYRIYNKTQTAELYNAVVSGGSGISINTTIGAGLDIEVGDVLELRVTYQSGTTYKKPIISLATATTSGVSWADSQEAWDEVESYALDGSDYDYTASGGTGPFEADFTNDEPDYRLTSNFTGAQFGAWIGYILTTSDGIAQWVGGYTFVDAANIRINTSIVGGLFDNQTTTEVYQTDSIRIYRDDGVRPVRNPSTGGGGIDLNWKSLVYLQTTGSGPLTSGQAAELTTAASRPSAAAIRTEIDSNSTQLAALVTGVNVSTMNGATVQGDGSELDPWRGVGVDP